MASPVDLTFAVSELPHTSAIRSGQIPVKGVNGNFLTIKPQIGAFRRMVRDVEFDVCEIAPTTYIIARAYGAPFVALPIFVVRRFHHATLLKHPDAGVTHPKDLEGKKVGVRAYSVTTGVWNRCILMEEYGLDPSKVNWVVDDEEHVTQLELPPNVTHVAEGDSLFDMMARGELAAAYSANAGIGRTGDPTGGWKTVKADYPKFFENSTELEADYYARTGIYPMHGTIVVRESVLKENPWVAKSIYDAFLQAKNEWLETLDTSGSDDKNDVKYRKIRSIVGPDPLPYGIDDNLKTIQALERTAFEQGLLPRRMSLEELFVDPAQIASYAE